MKFKDKKNAQLKIGESILVLMIFFIILTIGLVFYAKVQSHLTAEDVKEFKVKYTIDMALAVKFLPELQCTVQATEEFDCIDSVKIQSFLNIMAGPKYEVYDRYFSQIFPNARISINQAFAPNLELVDDILVFDNRYEKDESRVTSLTNITLPVTIYDPLTDSNSFGFIVLEAYN